MGKPALPVHVRALAGEIPAFTLRKKSLFSADYYVVAKWMDGTCIKVARFCERSIAEYWIEVESSHWLESYGLSKAA